MGVPRAGRRGVRLAYVEKVHNELDGLKWQGKKPCALRAFFIFWTNAAWYYEY